MTDERKEEKKPKKAYSLLSKLILAVIIFSIILETISAVSNAGGIYNIYKDQSTVAIVVTIMFIAAILFIIFEKDLDKLEKSIDNSGSGRNMKWMQIFGQWPELSIDKKNNDKKFKKFLNISRFIWWVSVVISIGVILYFILI